MAKKISDLFVSIGAKTDDFEKGVSKVKGEGQSLNSSFGKLGGVIAGAFSVAAITSFLASASELAQVAEGVEIAFKRIGNESTLEELRKATKGTVSDLELMKAAVQANNFGIPLKQLGSLLAFAHQRAKDTGQSVDYLVNSIVVGIGRKSPLILDNLGISAIQLKEKLKGVGTETASVGDVAKAVGEIASEAMSGIGESTDTVKEKLERSRAAWTNFKVDIGTSINTMIAWFYDLGESISRVFSSKRLSVFQKYLAFLLPNLGAKYNKQLIAEEKEIEAAVTKRFEHYKQQLEDIRKDTADNNKYWSYLNEYADQLFQKIDKISQTKGKISKQDLIDLITYEKEYELTTKIIDELATAEDEKYNPVKEAIDPKTIQLINDLKKKIEDLKSKIETAPSITIAAKFTKDLEKANEELLNLQKEIRNIAFGAPIGLGLKPLTPLPGKVTGGTQEIGIPEDKLNQMANAYQSFGEQIAKVNVDISNSMQSFAQNFAESFGQVLAGQMSIGDAFLGLMADFMKQLGQEMIAVGTAGLALKVLALSPGAALAAGIALVALAGAAQATLASGPTGTSNSGGGVSSGAYSGIGKNELTVYIEGVTKGSDIYWSQKNYNNKLNSTIQR